MIINKVFEKVTVERNAASTTLTCLATPEAKKAFVAGDFNGWNPQADAMVRRNGFFARSIKLAPGEHQYKFIIDGTWQVDPSARTIVSGLGTSNNVVHV
jgi:1,4-alpha-glucan branching enzyme